MHSASASACCSIACWLAWAAQFQFPWLGGFLPLCLAPSLLPNIQLLRRNRSLRPASASTFSATLDCRCRRFASALSAAAVLMSESEFAHSRKQLSRDQASNLERLRTRKVRRAKVAQGAATKQELLIPNAGRPVFEGVHSTGYDS